jgi:hypothetical protein
MSEKRYKPAVIEAFIRREASDQRVAASVARKRGDQVYSGADTPDMVRRKVKLARYTANSLREPMKGAENAPYYGRKLAAYARRKSK